MSALTVEEKSFAKEFYDRLWSCDNKQSLESFYDDFIGTYEKLIQINDFYNCAVKNLVSKIVSIFANESLLDKKFIDIGCGTGEIGRQLSETGNWDIDGIDLSSKMLEVCRDRGFYKNLMNLAITTEKTEGIEENTYDAAFSSGCYVENHIPLDTLEELRRIVKPGGYIIYTLNDPNYTMNYMEVQGRFIKEKKLHLISMETTKYKREVTMNFEYIYGYIVVFQVLPIE